jgi:hypothetical protein
MQDRPTATELLDAVRDFLAGERRLDPFLQRVATNVLAIVAREVELSPAMDAAERARLADLLGHEGALHDLNVEFARAIREGTFASGTLLEHLRQTAREKLSIANPKYLRSGDQEI